MKLKTDLFFAKIPWTYLEAYSEPWKSSMIEALVKIFNCSIFLTIFAEGLHLRFDAWLPSDDASDILKKYKRYLATVVSCYNILSIEILHEKINIGNFTIIIFATIVTKIYVL